MTNSADFESRLTALSQRLQGLDDEFSRKANILLDELIVGFEETDGQIRKLTNRLDQLAVKVDQLTESQQTTQGTIDQLSQLLVYSIESSNQDRAEIRRIWEYLLGQQQNGNGSRGNQSP